MTNIGSDESGVLIFPVRLSVFGRNVDFIRLGRCLPEITNGTAKTAPDFGEDAFAAENDQDQQPE